ncbi:uncharacterized protein LOC128792283 [Vidua chalybeata]|uniref:uncharacterized protein LOC128792283 n=1 Tax=Vidua chalybeata TaxID=81927 RepID=UPI0023A83F78|nr:uncharacterized protein LOC128792283 [Vidua chalybeata]
MTLGLESALAWPPASHLPLPSPSLVAQLKTRRFIFTLIGGCPGRGPALARAHLSLPCTGPMSLCATPRTVGRIHSTTPQLPCSCSQATQASPRQVSSASVYSNRREKNTGKMLENMIVKLQTLTASPRSCATTSHHSPEDSRTEWQEMSGAQQEPNPKRQHTTHSTSDPLPCRALELCWLCSQCGCSPSHGDIDIPTDSLHHK